MNSKEENRISATHKEANPAPLGLFGFGMTTILLNLHNSGLLPLSVVIIAMGFALGGLAQSLAWYLLLWGIFTLFMLIGTLKQTRANQVVFGSLTLLFFLLAIGDFTGMHMITTIAGVVGIFCGGSALYAAFAQVLNEVYGKTVMKL